MGQKRVLVIDDHRDSADMLAAVLRARNPGMDVEVGYDGESAVALAKQHQPTCAILDLELPSLGGAEAAARIRSSMPEHPPLLIALSGNFFKIAKAQQGTLFDHAFVKPVDLKRLLAILQAA
jgi:CheY-like chemotaxis protein